KNISYGVILKNMPFFNSKIKFEKLMEIIKLFFFEIKIKNIAKISKINKKTVKAIILSVLRWIKNLLKKIVFYSVEMKSLLKWTKVYLGKENIIGEELKNKHG
ncbi:hypothetical protein COBT_004284, partial [Conglomerata obtusa]